MAELPSVLSDPPWRRTRAPTDAADVEAAAEPEAARLAWLAGERDAFLGTTARGLTGDVEERLYERLFEVADGPQPLAVSDLARVSDVHLAELREEMKPRNMDEKVHRHLLARLGHVHLPSAVALVKAALGQQGIGAAWPFELLGPLRAPELVAPAADLFAQRALPTADMLALPYPMKPVDAWLLRHADLVARVLAARDDKPARVALTWIAAARGAVAGLPDAFAAFTPLAALERPWLAFLAARGVQATRSASARSSQRGRWPAAIARPRRSG